MKKRKFTRQCELYPAMPNTMNRNQSSEHTPKKDIEAILSLCSKARKKVLEYPELSPNAVRVFMDLMFNITRIFSKDITIKDFTEECDITSQSLKEVENIVSLTVDSTEKCLRIIDHSLSEKNYVYGLTAAKELLESINATFVDLKAN